MLELALDPGLMLMLELELVLGFFVFVVVARPLSKLVVQRTL